MMMDGGRTDVVAGRSNVLTFFPSSKSDLFLAVIYSLVSVYLPRNELNEIVLKQREITLTSC